MNETCFICGQDLGVITPWLHVYLIHSSSSTRRCWCEHPASCGFTNFVQHIEGISDPIVHWLEWQLR
jgi:hypothetical protein